MTSQPGKSSRDCSEIIHDGPARERMIEGLAEVRTLLRGPSIGSASSGGTGGSGDYGSDATINCRDVASLSARDWVFALPKRSELGFYG